MIQRIQTIHLLNTAIVMGIFIAMPLFTYGGNDVLIEFSAPDCILLLITSIAIVALSLLNIFLYNNRKLQIKLGYLTAFLFIPVFVFMGLHGYAIFQKNMPTVETDPSTNMTFWIGLPVIALIFLLLAIRGVKKDEKLVKSLDRLR